MSSDLDEQCARALGWTCEEEETYWPNTEMVWRDRGGHKAKFPPAARLLEDEIERRGLSTLNTYVSALWDECGCVGTDEGPAIWADEWKLIRATPEQKARAFIATMERKP